MTTGNARLVRPRAWARDEDPRRLWPALARPARRYQPARGADVLGERVLGTLARRRSLRDDRERAARVCEASDGLRTMSDRALNERIEHVHEEFVTSSAGAMDGAYAVMREVIRRELGLSLHVEQVMGAIAMGEGFAVEMATGEGKTLTAILPAALRGFAGRGVHVLTVNDYLARRDARTTMPAYLRLGLSVGFVVEGMKPVERRAAYNRAVTYASDKQVIFDHLRDRLSKPLTNSLSGVLLDEISGAVHDASERGGTREEADTTRRDWARVVVQRDLYAAIVDEADSVLIDEAVTPAIIGLDRPGDAGDAARFALADAIGREMRLGEHFRVDLRRREVVFTREGRSWLAHRAGVLPAFWRGPLRSEELVRQSLIAHHLHVSGDDYIVRSGKVEIVDRETGRVLEGRQWQLGLHQAIEAKEGVEVTPDRGTVARTSYAGFFRRYRHLAGMSGTLWEVRGELWSSYGMRVCRVPTHRPVARVRHADRVFGTESAKFEAIAGEVARLHDARRPVLVGTRSVEASERLGTLLRDRGIQAMILNANREEEEAEIVSRAGHAGGVTVATNMAGRGTDILLDDASRAGGGLVVIASERHAEARVDRQLFGRSGRQGDPGEAVAMVSFEDQLIARYGLGPLAWLARRVPMLRRLLWWQAQRTAGRRSAMSRRETTKADAWLDLAMHHEFR
ncbi:MAG: hypothetical protein RBS39_09405 [Phycisphaerales bacterium]|nr:hypothetical protein [Phycisphaerales bacterium]